MARLCTSARCAAILRAGSTWVYIEMDLHDRKI
jgi:hypothetical protein